MTVLTNFRIDEETRRQFHIYCIENNTSIAARLREYIKWDLEDRSLRREPLRKTQKKESAAKFFDQLSQERRWEDSY